jgi:hypothetical protein
VLQTSGIKRYGIERVFQKEGVYLIIACFKAIYAFFHAETGDETLETL